LFKEANMSRKSLWNCCTFILALLLLLLPTACIPVEATCTWGTIDRPVLTAPAWDEVVDTLNPTFTWTYADTECPAARFELTVGTNDIAVSLGSGVLYPVTETTFTWPETLEPGKTYWWIVVPIVDTAAGEVEGPPSEAVFPFNTGPMCAEADSLSVPTLIYPVNEAVIDRSDGFGFAWDDPTACIPGPYYLEISPTLDFSTVYTFGGELRTSMGVYSDAYFTFEDCARYYWRVHAQRSDGTYGPYSGIWSFVIDTGALACDLGVTPTPVPGLPGALAKADSVCRSGPGMDYPVLGYLSQGQSFPIECRNEANTWWLIRLNNQLTCWVFGELVDVTGDASQAPVCQAPPPPITLTAPPPVVNCSQYNTNAAACNANQACQWVLTQQYPNGICINK
jgi:uncharacterized protein YraI